MSLAASSPTKRMSGSLPRSAARMGIPLEKVINNIDRFGNTTAATIPLAMATAMEENRIHKGDLVLIASVGAGFTVGAALLRWEI
jgi:3-oxoacyl-[acyl-carrier-protein] synthase-3